MSPVGAATTVSAAELVRFATDVLTAIGMSGPEAAGMAETVVAADLAGHESCGLRQLSAYVAACQEGRVDPAGRPFVDVDHGSMLRVDGANAFGQITFRYATELVVQRAKQFGICGVAVRHSHHLGRVADLCELAARQGVVTMFALNQSGAAQVVVPHGGTEPRLATNPIAFGVPRSRPEGPHLVVDLATSAVAAGRLAEQRDLGLPDPPEWVTAAGLLAPAAGAKGFGLALVVEALAGALGGGGTVGPRERPDVQAAFVVGIDAAVLRPLAEVTADLDGALEHVRTASAADPATPVRIPGESSAATAARRRADGVAVRAHTWHSLHRLGADLQVRPPDPSA